MSTLMSHLHSSATFDCTLEVYGPDLFFAVIESIVSLVFLTYAVDFHVPHTQKLLQRLAELSARTHLKRDYASPAPG